MAASLNRRLFMQSSAGAAAALSIGLNASGALAAMGADQSLQTTFVRIDADGSVTVVLKHFEMGQGTTTGLTTLVAEELDADWARVKTDFAPADKARYANLFFGAQGTGGSTAIANSFMQYRKAGAAARDLLVRAAAERWKTDPAKITVSAGVVSDGKRKAGFGELAAAAARLTPAENPVLKTPDQFKLIGKADLGRKDSRSKTDGSAVFAMDYKTPGMVHAVIARPPRFGALVAGFDDAPARSMSGYVDARMLPNRAGVAIYAKTTWDAFKAREMIKVQWDDSKAEKRSSEQMVEDMRQAAQAPQYKVRGAGGLPASARRVEAEFVFPFLAHAPMEPLNCVIQAEGDGVLVHDGCQFPATAQPVIAGILGLKPEQVNIKTLYAGGSFGRRATPNADYHAEAAMAFDLLGRKVPVKLMWNREDDLTGGYYRPPALHKIAAALDDKGAILGWDHKLTAKPILKGTLFESFAVHDGVDHTSVEGVVDTLYALPGFSVGLTDFQTPVPILWWRSVGHTHTAFAMESMIDMIAAEQGKDPVALRLELLNQTAPDAKQTRMIGVIKTASEAAGWDKPAAAGIHRGMASHFSFNTYVAVIAEIEMKGDAARVRKLTMAVDCGIAVNPDVIKAQMEGGAGFALSAALRNEITLDQGRVEQSNFPDYDPLRIHEMPEIEVRIVASAEPPTGVGEPGVPPVAPALANALFAATGKRAQRLPLTRAGFTFA